MSESASMRLPAKALLAVTIVLAGVSQTLAQPADRRHQFGHPRLGLAPRRPQSLSTAAPTPNTTAHGSPHHLSAASQHIPL